MEYVFDDLALFVAIVEAGSLNQAAARSGTPPATVTRRLQRLEEQLGVRLLHRSARRLVPTAEGWQYYAQCRPLLHALTQATQSLDQSMHQVSGSIRVLAPVNLANGALLGAWPGFLARYPAVSLELELSNEVQDIVGRGADLAIRVGPQADSLLVQRRLGRIELVLVASPAYLAQHGSPADPDALSQHALIVAEPIRAWRFRDPENGAERTLMPTASRLRVNDLRLAVTLAEQGFGLLLCPLTECHAAIERGALSCVLEPWRAAARDVFAVWPQQGFTPARVKALIEHLAAYAASTPLLGGDHQAVAAGGLGA